MKRHTPWIMVGTAVLATALQAAAAPLSLFEYALNIDGVVTQGAAPALVDMAAFDSVTGLGTISLALSGAGNRYVALFVDHEIDEETNTFFNETASHSGVAAAGQSWEIDEPGFVFGDIYSHFAAGALDDSNAFQAGLLDDVAMAMGWRFALAEGETARLSFLLSEQAPGSGLQLMQSDPDSGRAVWLSGSLQISGGQQIPAPATPALVLLGLLALTGSRRRRPAGC